MLGAIARFIARLLGRPFHERADQRVGCWFDSAATSIARGRAILDPMTLALERVGRQGNSPPRRVGMHRRPVYLVAGEVQRDQHRVDCVSIRFLAIQTGNPGSGLPACAKTNLGRRQQDRVRPDLEKRAALELRQRQHSICEPHRFANMTAPISFVRRDRHRLAGQVGNEGHPRRVVFELTRNILEFIKNGIAPRRMKGIRDTQFLINDVLPS